MGDSISRELTIDTLKTHFEYEKRDSDTFWQFWHDDAVLDVISSIPTSQPCWIPVTEKLPDMYTTVIVSCIDNRGDTPFDYTACGYWVGLLPDDDPAWIVDGEVNWDVVAWMELPEPWRK